MSPSWGQGWNPKPFDVQADALTTERPARAVGHVYLPLVSVTLCSDTNVGERRTFSR